MRIVPFTCDPNFVRSDALLDQIGSQSPGARSSTALIGFRGVESVYVASVLRYNHNFFEVSTTLIQQFKTYDASSVGDVAGFGNPIVAF